MPETAYEVAHIWEIATCRAPHHYGGCGEMSCAVREMCRLGSKNDVLMVGYPALTVYQRLLPELKLWHGSAAMKTGTNELWLSIETLLITDSIFTCINSSRLPISLCFMSSNHSWKFQNYDRNIWHYIWRWIIFMFLWILVCQAIRLKYVLVSVIDIFQSFRSKLAQANYALWLAK